MILKDFIVDGRTFQVSDCGKIFSKGKELKPMVTRTGYCYVCPRQIRMYVHRIVMIAFTGLKDGLDVNHKNGIKSDNNLSNLEWCTRSENLIHSFRVLGRKQVKHQLGKSGALHHRSKPVYQIDLSTGNVIKRFESIRQAGLLTNRPHCNISAVLQNRSGAKQSGGFGWRYAE